MIRSRPFGNAAGSAARIAPSRRSEQLALVLLEIELSQEHINETPKKARGDRRCRSKFRKLGHRDSATASEPTSYIALGAAAPRSSAPF